MWSNIAASKNRDIVAKRMTPNQIAESQKLAPECVRKKFKGCRVATFPDLLTDSPTNLFKGLGGIFRSIFNWLVTLLVTFAAFTCPKCFSRVPPYAFGGRQLRTYRASEFPVAGDTFDLFRGATSL